MIKIDKGHTRKQYDKLPPQVRRFITFEDYCKPMAYDTETRQRVPMPAKAKAGRHATG